MLLQELFKPESVCSAVFTISYIVHKQALESLNKKDMTEIKSYAKPPTLVEKVMEAVMILRGQDPTWSEAKRQLGNSQCLGYGDVFTLFPCFCWLLCWFLSSHPTQSHDFTRRWLGLHALVIWCGIFNQRVYVYDPQVVFFGFYPDAFVLQLQLFLVDTILCF